VVFGRVGIDANSHEEWKLELETSRLKMEGPWREMLIECLTFCLRFEGMMQG
jgi:hypothetical protein